MPSNLPWASWISQPLSAEVQPPSQSELTQTLTPPRPICFAPESDVLPSIIPLPAPPSNLAPPAPPVPNYSTSEWSLESSAQPESFTSSLNSETTTPDPNLETSSTSYPDGTLINYSFFGTLDLNQVKSVSDLPRNLTAKNINPSINLGAINKSAVDFSIVAYGAFITYMGSMLMSNDYILSSAEAEQVLRNLPVKVPIITSIGDPKGNYQVHWYSLDANGNFESYDTTHAVIQNKLYGIPLPATQLTLVPETFITDIAAPIVAAPIVAENPQPEISAPAPKAFLIEEAPVNQQKEAAPYEPISNLILQNYTAPSVQQSSIDLSAIAPIQTSEFELLDERFWERLQKKSEAADPIPAEIKFNFAEV